MLIFLLCCCCCCCFDIIIDNDDVVGSDGDVGVCAGVDADAVEEKEERFDKIDDIIYWCVVVGVLFIAN